MVICHCSYCGKLIKSENMTYTFLYYGFLTATQEILSSVTDMRGTFYGCTSLTGTIEINANPTSYSGCFYNTQKNIKLMGSSTILDKLAATAKGNVTVDRT